MLVSHYVHVHISSILLYLSVLHDHRIFGQPAGLGGLLAGGLRAPGSLLLEIVINSDDIIIFAIGGGLLWDGRT